jgi:hypothetical protein
MNILPESAVFAKPTMKAVFEVEEGVLPVQK